MNIFSLFDFLDIFGFIFGVLVTWSFISIFPTFHSYNDACCSLPLFFYSNLIIFTWRFFFILGNSGCRLVLEIHFQTESLKKWYFSMKLRHHYFFPFVSFLLASLIFMVIQADFSKFLSIAWHEKFERANINSCFNNYIIKNKFLL